MATKAKNNVKGLVGKRSILQTFDEHSNFDNPVLQNIMHRANNCNATKWTCKNCAITTLSKCIEKTREYFQMEAFKKYKDNPRYRELIAKEHGVHL